LAGSDGALYLGKPKFSAAGRRREQSMSEIWRELGSPSAGASARARQTTLREAISLGGTGVHSNAPARLTLNPAAADNGLTFEFLGSRGRRLAADWTNVSDTELRTGLGAPGAGSIATVEHLLAACGGLGLDNLNVAIEGPEVPAFDGSAAVFASAIDRVGLLHLGRRRRTLRVLRPVRVGQGSSYAELSPAVDGLTIDVELDFSAPVIGRQRKVLRLDPGTFRRELARARSFGFLSDLAPLQARGLALGASMENTIALLGDAVLNPEGLRFPDEFVRHKMLDVVGDLALAGAPIIGQFRSYRGGHALNIAALRALFADPSSYAVEPLCRRASREGGGRVGCDISAACP
jgi:UDP-3-O-[3-hydroxymyristoyl] N-acetylglucosamine deacetylase